MQLLGILELPWGDAAAFLGFWIALLTLMGLIGSRIPKVNRWLGVSIQNLLGITDLSQQLNNYIASNDEAGRKRDEAIARLAETVERAVGK